MERLQTGQDRSSTSKVIRLNTVPAGQRYAMVMPSYFSSLSMFNAKRPPPHHHDMQEKTILAFRRIVLFFGRANAIWSQGWRGMRSMRMPYSVCIISRLLLVAVIGAIGLPSISTAVPGEKISDFFKYANGTALDTRTNLMWMTQDFRNLEGRAPASWDEAMTWAEKMNQQRYGGYSDWRVPTPE